MNVMNRKMFANRDARRKLANMGGILASSPELMSTAQMFSNGGQGSVPVKTKTVIIGDPLGGARYDLYSDGSAIMLATGTRINPDNASNQAFLQMLQGLPDVTNTSISQPPEINEPKLNTTPVLNRPLLPIRDNRQELQDMIESGTELVPGVNVPGPSEQYVMDKTSPNYTARDPSEIPELAIDARGELEDMIQANTELVPGVNVPMTRTQAMVKSGELPDSRDIEDKPGTLTDDLQRFLIDKTNVLRAGGIDYGNRPATPDMVAKSTGTNTDTDTDKVAAATDKGYYVSPGVKAIKGFFGIGDDEEEEEEEKKTTETKEVEIAKDADADLDKPGERSFTPGEDDTIAALEKIATSGGTSEQKVEKIRKEVFGPGVDSKTAIAQYQTKFNDILGEDRDLNEEKWHTLAMIGFAIAAGEDSNALTNIANGLLEGTKMAREDRATRQARKDKINMLALEQFFADERLRQELTGRENVANIQASARVPAEFEAKPTLEEAIDDAARAEMKAAEAVGQYLPYADAVKLVTPTVTELYGKKRTSDSNDNLSDEAAARKAAEEKLGLT
jgi:hypothetical protein